MNRLKTIWRHLRSLVSRNAVKREIDEELRFHLEQRIAENVAAGVSGEEAARQARRRFGNVQSIREDCRDSRRASFGEETLRDLRFAARQLAKSPGFTAIALLSLAFGIGAGTAVFSVANAILLRSLPVPNPHELRALRWTGREARIPSLNGNASVSHPVFLSLREQAAGQADVFGFSPLNEVIAQSSGEPYVTQGTMVSDNFFTALGVNPLLGRLLIPGEDFRGAGTSVILSHHCWATCFSQDPAAIGRNFVLNGNNYVVVGVLPPGFAGVQPGAPSDFYVPMATQSRFLYRPITDNAHWFVRLMARLRPGGSDARLEAALQLAFAREVGQVITSPRVLVEKARSGPAYDRPDYRKPLLLMLGAVGLIQLVACANLAGLLLARSTARRHELSVRAALGAGRWRLIRQSFAESLFLALLGGGFGVLIAIWGRDSIGQLLAGSADGLRYDVSLDRSVLAFNLVISLGTALLAGLLPALRAGQIDPAAGLKSRVASTPPQLRAGRVLVATQICLSLLLLTGAGLYLRTLANLSRLDAGFSVDRLLLVQLNINGSRYAEMQPAEFYARVQGAMASVPGVKAVTVIEFPLLSGAASSGGVDFVDRAAVPGKDASTCRLTVSETFFGTLGIPVLQGRGFSAADNENAPKVVVVNQAFVREFLPDVDPLGHSMRMWATNWQIVGVCADTKYDDLKVAAPPTTYFPLGQRFYSRFRQTHLRAPYLAVRTALPPLALRTAVHQVVTEIDPGVAIARMTTQQEVRDRGIGQERLFAALCASLAGLAMLLSCIGLYGLMSYHVARRTGEIAIRLALGATRWNMAGPVLREALVLAGVGVLAGIPAVFALSGFVRSQLYGVEHNDPLTLFGSGGILVVIALIAAWLPALRAAKVSPMTALRAE